MIVEVRECIARGTEGCLDVEGEPEYAGSKGGGGVTGVYSCPSSYETYQVLCGNMILTL